jgi:hypothetical protein
MIGRFMMVMTAAAALALAGCSLPKPDPKAEALARSLYDQVRHGQDDAVAQEMTPEAKSGDLKAQLAQIRSFIPAGEPKSATLRSWNLSTVMGKGDTAVLVYAYDYGDKVTLSEVALTRQNAGTAWLVQGFHVETRGANEAPAQAPPPPAISGGGEEQAPARPTAKPPAKPGDKT